MTDTIVERVTAALEREIARAGDDYPHPSMLARAAITAHRNAMSEGVGELVERFRDMCRDWNGEQIVDGSTPRYEPSCGDIRQAADTITALQARLAEVTGALEIAEESLDQLLDDMGEDGQCVCLEAKKEAVEALAAARAAL